MVCTLRRGALERCADDITPAETLRIHALKERLSDFSGIRPCDAYGLNMAMTPSALGTLVTYVIVLLQFKVSEL